MTPAGRLRLLLANGQFRRVRLLWSAEVISLGALVVSGLVVARALGPATYGRFALLAAFGGLVYALIEPRAGEVVTKYFGTAAGRGRSRDARAVLRGAVALDAAAVVLAVTVTAAIAPLLPALAPGSVGEAALAAAAAALAGPILTARAVLAALDCYRTFARVQTAAGLARAGASAAAAVLTGDVTVVLAVLAAAGALELALGSLVAWQAVRSRHGRGPDESRTRLRDVPAAAPGVLRFVAYSEGTTLLASFSKHADTLVVGALGGNEQAGLYRLAKSLTTPVGSLVLPLQTVVYNRFVAVSLEPGRSRLPAVARRATRSALPLALLLAAASPLVPPAVRLLAGADFSQAGPVAVVMLLAAALGLPLFWLRSAYLVLDRLPTWLWVSTATSLVSVVAFVAGAAVAGALGVAVARLVVVTLIANLVLLALLRRRPRPASPSSPCG